MDSPPLRGGDEPARRGPRPPAICRVLGLALAIAGCASGQDLRVAIPFSATIDGAAFSCSGTRGFAPSDLRFYVHDLALIDAAGRTIPIRLADDGTWQRGGVALIDFENGRDNCREGTAGTHTTLTGSVAAGDYRALRFVVGVPFARNHADAATAGAPLNLGRMHWGWQGGYKFLRFEGGGDGSAFRFHLGSTACEGTIGNITSCGRPNRAPIDLDAFALGRDGVHLELSAFTRSATASPASASCMAEQAGFQCRRRQREPAEGQAPRRLSAHRHRARRPDRVPRESDRSGLPQ